MCRTRCSFAVIIYRYCQSHNPARPKASCRSSTGIWAPSVLARIRSAASGTVLGAQTTGGGADLPSPLPLGRPPTRQTTAPCTLHFFVSCLPGGCEAVTQRASMFRCDEHVGGGDTPERASEEIILDGPPRWRSQDMATIQLQNAAF